ncbi:hypothetical protein JOD18_003897 [Gracilibacillus alcaliphilus]|nr:hypothetical protein [Gracilibacillus alcaliphilus]
MSVAFTNPDLFDLKVYLYTDGERFLVGETLLIAGIVRVLGSILSGKGMNKLHNKKRLLLPVYCVPLHIFCQFY